MRLKGRHQAASGPGLPGRLQGGRDLAGMMSVIVHERHLATAHRDIAQQFKTAPQRTAFRQRLAYELHVDAEFVAKGHDRQRIQSVVPTREIDGHHRALPAGQRDLHA